MFKVIHILILLLMTITVFPLFLYLVVGFALNLVSTKNLKYRMFLNGKIPKPPLDGNYIGIADISLNWVGKSFDPESKTGINKFKFGKKIKQYFPFTIIYFQLEK